MTWAWPSDLSLEIVEAEINTVEIQRWIHKQRASVARIKRLPGMENDSFDELVRSLRNCGGVGLRVSLPIYPLTPFTVCDRGVGG
jgi:hypothetical protein